MARSKSYKNPNKLKMTSPVFPARLHCLDLLRALAALAVVFWHWQHFFYVGQETVGFQVEAQPYYAVFAVLYRHGARAVDLFFALSGFIFFWLYADAIARGSVRAWHFTVLRFSRLYPLHFATFVMVWALQAVAQQQLGEPFVYPHNDGYHALLNLLLVPAWGFESGWSFNAPIWSVSVEVLLYLLFFCTLRWCRWPVAGCLAFIAAGAWLMPVHPKIATGLCAFFAGGLAFMISKALILRCGKQATLSGLALISIAAWCYTYVAEPDPLVLDLLVFPSTIALLAVLQACVPDMFQRQAWLGELSYSTYLLHFPLQLIFVLAASALGAERNVFYAEWLFILYFVVLIAAGFTSYRYFEAPMQRYLRRRLLRVAQKPSSRPQVSV